MRPPAQMPPRRARPGHSRVGVVVAAAVVLFALTSVRGLARFYTDYLWFDEIGQSGVWRTVLGTKALLALAFVAALFALLWANLAIADRLTPAFRLAAPDDEIVQRYREVVGPHSGRVRTVVAALFALLFGSGAAGQWNNWVMFRNATSFGATDRQFGRDIGFYVFRLPFLTYLVDWLLFAVIVTAVVTVVAHYLNGGIRLQAPAQRVSPQVKAHISVLLGVVALLKAAGYYLQRYELNFSTRGVVQGPTYTDVNVQLPALNLLVYISLVAAALLVYNIWRRGWVLPAIAVGLWALVSVLAGAVVPALVQQFRVRPAEATLERPYIERNIAATRRAMDLEQVEDVEFTYNEDYTPEEREQNEATLENLRIWDPGVAGQAFQPLQAIKPYYEIDDVDVDRYRLGDEVRQINIATRGLRPSALPSDSWVSQRLQYTHGYGVVAAPANAATPNGQPEFSLQNIPPRGDPDLKTPQVYYGENANGYSIVNSATPEFDYPEADRDVTNSYTGEGGVLLNSRLRRAALALRFNDFNLFISNEVTSESKALYIQDVKDRVRTAAPFLRYDADPYPVVVGGGISWVQDAYTATSRYPNAEQVDVGAGAADNSELRSGFNYVRNSVKAVVDAYDGTVDFYVVDPDDPMARAYDRAFPGLFQPADALPDDLEAHLRYPEDLFRAQAAVYGRYHVTDPGQFFNGGDAWNVAQDPDATAVVPPAVAGTPASTARTAVGQAQSRTPRMDPYYLLMRLPDEERESFLMMQTFQPAGREERLNMTAFLVAKSDPGSYGELKAYEMPRDRQILGPAQAAARIQQQPTISEQITLLGTRGSAVVPGNLLVVPVGDSLLYVRPLFIASERNPIPEFKLAAMVSGQDVVVGPDVDSALDQIFDGAPAPPSGTDPPPDRPDVPSPGADADVPDLLAQADAAFAAAEAALARSDLAAYQREVNRARALVNQAQARSQGSAPTATTAPPTQA